ncbi:hypothetical protein BS47DRAFT_282917 [Hydnum rufescens UP504]|uniref:F-box domain-containing protein n=1 Tax=Hydnum rufescens UP504 TaxID=1448309 RepID=A0A9P6DN75_9AGAM|nr:hypothetical protein BS47DRAFT_282917 [Hydnum rufescens UP504]
MKRLPAELLIQVLTALPFPAVLRARHVCRYWQKVIQSSVILEYHVELEAHRKTDNPESTLSVVDRLKILRKHVDAWQNLSWSRRDLFDLKDVFPRLDALKPYLPEVKIPLQDWHEGHEIRVSLHGFPSTLAQTSSRNCLRDGLTLQTRYFIIDAEQDIIIFSEPYFLPTQSPWRCVRLQSLSTVGISPDEPRVLYRYLCGGFNGSVEDILGDFVLLSLTNYECTVIAIVVQWTTGWVVSKLEFPYRDIDELYPTMAFLSVRHFLVTIGRGSDSSAGLDDPACSRIAVYEFHPVHRRLNDEDVPTPLHVASYLLPDSQSLRGGRGFSLRSHPPTISPIRGWSPKPFTESADDWILSIEFASEILEQNNDSLDPDGSTPTRIIQIVTHASTLLRYTSANTSSSGPIEVSWEDWGLEGARCFPGHSHGQILDPRIYGERCAILAVLVEEVDYPDSSDIPGTPAPTESPEGIQDVQGTLGVGQAPAMGNGLDPGLDDVFSRIFRLYMYDFNQARVRRAQQASTSVRGPGWPPLQAGPRVIHSLEDSAPQGDTIKCQAVDGGQITGRLPYVATVIDVLVTGFCSFDIDEERLIFLTVRFRNSALSRTRVPSLSLRYRRQCRFFWYRIYRAPSLPMRTSRLTIFD